MKSKRHFRIIQTCPKGLGEGTMIKLILLFPLLIGVFPYTFSFYTRITRLQFSKFGLFANLCCCVFLIYEILILFLSLIEAVQHQSPSADLKLAIKMANTAFLLVILIRRLVIRKEETYMLNKVFDKSHQTDKQWYEKYHEVGIVFIVELFEIITEYGVSCYVQFWKNSTFHSYHLTSLIRLGFETSILAMLTTEQRLHVYLNDFFRCRVETKNPLNLHDFRMKLNDLHELRMLTNKCYGFDLLLYFISVQLLMLLECFDWVKMFSNDDVVKMARMLLGMLRITRLFWIMAYVIGKWSSVGEEGRKTLEYLFEYNANEFSRHANHQLALLLEEIQTRNKLFSAHKLYDINMPLLYNICGTVFAYLILIMTSSLVQS